ncbi:MAG: esterase/lipase family protein, partial [Giesbergeria sp.]
MIARMQLLALVSLVLSLAAWWAWALPQGLDLAWAGMGVFAGMYVLGLGLPFVLMHAVNRGDVAPRASLAQVLRAAGAEARWALVVFGWRQPLRSASVPDWLPEAPNGQRGVVLVHGFLCNRGLWLSWMPLLRSRGHAYVAVNLEPVFGSIDAYASTVDDAVRRVTQATGLPPVIVAHSMGGLATRAWLRAFSADARVHRVITLGTPHGGTWLGRWSQATNGRQMQLTSPWLQQLQLDEPLTRARLFTCWYSNCDNIVFPARTAALPGARQRFVAGL